MSEKTMPEGKVYGLAEEELARRPTVFRDDLFKGQTVLVSGAGSGLGRAIAFLFARLGADLVICGRDEAKLRTVETWLRDFGADVDVHAMTIRDADRVAALMDAVWEKHGTLDLLVNNAGGQFPQKAIDYSVKGWNAVIDTNLNGTWYMMQAAARHWIDHGQPGNIVNIVSIYQRGQPDIAHTCAARAGVTYLSKTVAVEWAPHKIRVNCVAPGCVETEGFNVYPPLAAEMYTYSNPMLHAGDVQDVAEACVYLAAPSGKFINGEVLAIDGGQQMWGDVWSHGRPKYFDVADWTANRAAAGEGEATED
ncbi:MAG: SDR family oxidoreductase [Alphaproteobacteria bacterium]|nr:SDR family oxidoreductase [Alphaproteobacteria bacterium]